MRAHRKQPSDIEPVGKRSAGKVKLDESTRRLVGRLWRDWMRQYWRQIVLGMTMMVVLALASGGYPLLINEAIEAMTAFEAGDALSEAEQAANERLLYLIPIGVLVLTVIKGMSTYAQSVLVQGVAFRVIKDFQRALFRHLLRADLATYQSTETGKLISRFNVDVFMMRDGLSKAMTGLVRDTLMLVVMIGAMFYLNWMLAAGVFIIFPLSAIPIVKLGRRLRRVSRSTQAEIGEMTHLLDESFSGARVVKAYRLEDRMAERADQSFETVRSLSMKGVRARARTYPVLEILGGIAIAVVFAIGGFMILAGYGTLGEFAGFVTALFMAYQPATGLGSLNASLQESLAAVHRVFGVLDTKPQILDAPDAKPLAVKAGEIRFDGVSFGYGDNIPALKGLNLVAEAGKTTAIVGPSGAGKSTALNLVPRFYDAQQGTILYDGQDVRAVTLDSLRDATALVSQDVVLFNDTVRANIAFGASGRDAPPDDPAIQEAAKAAAAHDFIMALPDGYDTVVGERGGRLSGGERQRIAIARAMLKNAPVLLLDEATASLDAESERQVQTALARLMEGRTTIVIAHRLATVRDADRIYVLDGGAVAEEGTHAELFAAGGLYARLCRIQFRDDGSAPLAVEAGTAAGTA